MFFDYLYDYFQYWQKNDSNSYRSTKHILEKVYINTELGSVALTEQWYTSEASITIDQRFSTCGARSRVVKD